MVFVIRTPDQRPELVHRRRKIVAVREVAAFEPFHALAPARHVDEPRLLVIENRIQTLDVSPQLILGVRAVVEVSRNAVENNDQHFLGIFPKLKIRRVPSEVEGRFQVGFVEGAVQVL